MLVAGALLAGACDMQTGVSDPGIIDTAEKLHAAIAKTEAGGTILIQGAFSGENVTISKAITLLSNVDSFDPASLNILPSGNLTVGHNGSGALAVAPLRAFFINASNYYVEGAFDVSAGVVLNMVSAGESITIKKNATITVAESGMMLTTESALNTVKTKLAENSLLADIAKITIIGACSGKSVHPTTTDRVGSNGLTLALVTDLIPSPIPTTPADIAAFFADGNTAESLTISGNVQAYGAITVSGSHITKTIVLYSGNTLTVTALTVETDATFSIVCTGSTGGTLINNGAGIVKGAFNVGGGVTLKVNGSIKTEGAGAINRSAGSKFVYSSTATGTIGEDDSINGDDPAYSVSGNALFMEIAGTSTNNERRGWKHEISGGTVTLKKDATYSSTEECSSLTVKSGGTLNVEGDQTLKIESGGTLQVEVSATLSAGEDADIEIDDGGEFKVDGTVNVLAEGTLMLGSTTVGISEDSYLRGTIDVKGTVEDSKENYKAAFWNDNGNYGNKSTGKFVIHKDAEYSPRLENFDFESDAATITVRAPANSAATYEIGGGKVSLGANKEFTGDETLLIQSGATLYVGEYTLTMNGTATVKGELSFTTGKLGGTGAVNVESGGITIDNSPNDFWVDNTSAKIVYKTGAKAKLNNTLFIGNATDNPVFWLSSGNIVVGAHSLKLLSGIARVLIDAPIQPNTDAILSGGSTLTIASSKTLYLQGNLTVEAGSTISGSTGAKVQIAAGTGSVTGLTSNGTIDINGSGDTTITW
jgi:hypothetical protein